MKNDKFPLIILTFITIFIFKNNLLVHDAIINACNLFVFKIFPSLFPMMIISDLLIYFKLPELICHYFGSFFQKIFYINPYGLFAFFISCFSGSPTNAYTIKNLNLNGYLTCDEASHVLSFSFFNNPLFLNSMLLLIFPNNPLIVLKLILIPYIVNLFLAFITRQKNFNNTFSINRTNDNFGIFFTNTVKKAMNTLIFILGIITIFYLINIIINPLKLPFITGLLEISQGLNSLIDFTSSLKLKELLTTYFISFGGLSIHFQIKGIISDTNISYLKFLKFRIYQTIISCLVVLII